MDPNEALIKAREALKRYCVSGDEAEASDLADAFEALDTWLSKGGFLPDAWKPSSGSISKRADELQREQPSLSRRDAVWQAFDEQNPRTP
jgi:hypothetical protein